MRFGAGGDGNLARVEAGGRGPAGINTSSSDNININIK